MDYNSLKENAQLIIDNTPSGDFKDVSFSCSSGGCPINRAGVVVHRQSVHFAYVTTACGDAYKGELVIRCRPIQGKDGKGKQIYEDEQGNLFIFNYRRGDASSFDGGALCPPSVV